MRLSAPDIKHSIFAAASKDQIMPKPVLLCVDDDSDVLRAIERDLRSQYGAEYRVIGSDSPEGALDLLKQQIRTDPRPVPKAPPYPDKSFKYLP